MQNQNETGEGPQAIPDAGSDKPADLHPSDIAVCGDDSGKFTEEEMAQIAELAKAGGAREATIRGHRVIIVADMHHPALHLRLSALAHLAAADLLVVRDDERIVAPALELPQLTMKMIEPVIVEDFPDDRRGKGKRRKAWESPHDFHGQKQKARQPQRNIRQMMRRPGGR